MDSELKKIVDSCEIKEKKTKLEQDRIIMFNLEREMSKMIFNRNVGLYVRNCEEYMHLLSKSTSLTESEKQKLEELYLKIIISESDIDVIKYSQLKEEYNLLNKRRNIYQKSINLDLREKIIDYKLPDIFVYFGVSEKNKEFYRHIINSGVIDTNVRPESMIVYPQHNMSSNRECRHFYNKVSFSYLEGLTEDYSFDLDNKAIGKVKIRKL